MRQIFFAFLVGLGVFCCGMAKAASITILSPNGGENWLLGSAHTIQWSSDGVTGNVKIDLIARYGEIDAEVTSLAASVTNSGSYAWTISTSQAIGSRYRVRVSSVSSLTTFGVSAADFTLSSSTSITVISPNGGEEWRTGDTKTIQWSSANLTGNVKLELIYRYGMIGETVTTIAASVTNSGSYDWTIPTDLTISDNYRVKISSVVNTSIYDVSDANFTITSSGTITVVTPNGGENWTIGSTQTIAWTSQSLTGDVKIELIYRYGDIGEIDTTLVEATANDGSYAWAIADTETIGDAYRIRISSANNPSIEDISDANFSLTSNALIALVSPNGGESWQVGSPHSIAWTSENVTGNVKIELIYRYGEIDEIDSTLVESTANTSPYAWAIPAAAPLSAEYRIRISSVVNPLIFGISAANFALVSSSSIAVVAPNGGESWKVGTTHDIEWTSQNITGDVKIELAYRYGKIGETDSTLVEATANDGAYSWAIPASTTLSDEYKVKISSVANPTVFDVSDSDFSIVSVSSITVASPNGGERWQVGSARPIVWTSSGVTGNIKLELVYRYGQIGELVTPIAASVANNGLYTWTIPTNTPVSAEYKVKISSVNDPLVFDLSDADFSIISTATITLVSPVGGETWQVGAPHAIQWTSSGVTGNVKIALRTALGPVSVIADSVTNSGTYSWTVPADQAPGDNFIIRISSVNDPLIYGDSPAAFSIIPVVYMAPTIASDSPYYAPGRTATFAVCFQYTGTDSGNDFSACAFNVVLPDGWGDDTNNVSVDQFPGSPFAAAFSADTNTVSVEWATAFGSSDPGPAVTMTFTVSVPATFTGDAAVTSLFSWTNAYQIAGTPNPLTVPQGVKRTVIFAVGVSGGGILSGTTTQEVYDGENCSQVIAIHNKGYKFDQWKLNGSTYSTNNALTVTNVTANMIFTASFKVYYHSADYNPANWQIDIFELLRVVALYNNGLYYKVDATGPDGFNPSNTAVVFVPGTYHDADYNPQDGRIDIDELNRVTTLFNNGLYYIYDASGPDGYNPSGTAPASAASAK